ncbi:hypothetical protein C8Q78DRAFT_1083215 [Trametes maxima]|nr:hypothetical protein C8Q78DRAFT_1083215 [Trametes maxima]
MSSETQQEASATTTFDVAAFVRMFPLDEKLYSLKGDALRSMQAQTGIEDEEQLKKHILLVQAEAYTVVPFPCIRRFAFIETKIRSLEGYHQLLALAKEREGAIFLDIGSCFGNDVREAVADGFPAKQVVATDLYPDFWRLGHKLFRSTQESFPATFIPGDVFDPAHLAVTPPIYSTSSDPIPDLSTLSTLNPLRGHVSVIHASLFFHLFDEKKQANFARALAGLLSPLPGSMIFGLQAGARTKGDQYHTSVANGNTLSMFCHSPESWTELWDGQVFEKGMVDVKTKLVTADYPGLQREGFFLHWCITRL